MPATMPPDGPPTAAIKTLGCKLNQFESEQVRERLVALGCRIVPFEGPADIYVINSCTVTARTDRDCRRLIRHARKLNPRAFIAVTGCYVEVDAAAVEAVGAADLVAGNDAKPELARLIRRETAALLPWPPDAPQDAGAGAAPLGRFADHTRAFVKAQEGCDAACAYCVIPRARGPSRSVPPEQVLAQAARLMEAGHPEIVLMGTHLGKYGEDLPAAPDLAGLVEALCELPGAARLRLSSIEPREITNRLIHLVAHHPRVCRHFHIPLQSGCDTVLSRMGRPYDTALYARLLRRIHQAGPGICLGADVMVGFPGETDAEFARTRAFIADLPLSYLHVFTYSPRPGTPAADMPDQVPSEVKRARNHELRDLSEARRAAFANTQVGAVLEAVLERVVSKRPEVLDGLSDNYLRVHVPAPRELLGTIQAVAVTAAEGGVLRARRLAQDGLTPGVSQDEEQD